MATEGVEVVLGVTAVAVAVAPVEVSVLAVASARTVPTVSRLRMERLVQESEVAVLALTVVPQVSAPNQGWSLSFAVLQLLELLGLLRNKLISSWTIY